MNQFLNNTLIPVGDKNYFAWRDGKMGEFVFAGSKVNPGYEHMLAASTVMYGTLFHSRALLQVQLDALDRIMPTPESDALAKKLSAMFQILVDSATVALRTAELGTVQVGDELGATRDLSKKFPPKA